MTSHRENQNLSFSKWVISDQLRRQCVFVCIALAELASDRVALAERVSCSCASSGGGGGGGRVKFSLVADLTSDLTKVDGAQASKVAAALRGAFKC